MKGDIKMIGTDFIASTLQQAIYKLKEGTKSSYYHKQLLPPRNDFYTQALKKVLYKYY